MLFRFRFDITGISPERWSIITAYLNDRLRIQHRYAPATYEHGLAQFEVHFMVIKIKIAISRSLEVRRILNLIDFIGQCQVGWLLGGLHARNI